jgi:histidinol phosphatase-like PHP family hydrolase
MKKIIPKINLSKKNIKTFLVKFVDCKRLLFIILFGAMLIFTVDIIYRYAFININYIDYTEDSNFIISDGKINSIKLNRVLKNIDKNNKKIEIEADKKYNSPFDSNGFENFESF